MKRGLLFGAIAKCNSMANDVNSGLNRFLGTVLIGMMVLMSGGMFGQTLWNSSGSGGAWLTTGNWTGSVVPATTGYAQFQLNPTGAGQVGINMNGSTNNGSKNQAVGAIEVTGSRAVPLIIGNSSTSASADGTLTLNGNTVNSVSNVILRNTTTQLFTIQNNTAGGNRSMGLALGNTTENIINIDGSGGITISSIISGTNSNLTKAGSGNGVLTLSAVNTYTGTTKVNSGELRLNPSANNSLSGAFTFNGGTLATTGITANRTITFSSVNLFDDSTFALGTTNAHTVTFTNAGTFTSGKVLTITGWTGTPIGCSAGTVGKIFVGNSASALSATQLAQIKFTISGVDYPATLLATGQLVPTLNLVVTNPGNQIAGIGFSVTVTATDFNGTARNVPTNTGITLSSPTNTISGTTTGTINSGSNFVTISGVTLTAGSNATITATTTSGSTCIGAGTCGTFDVISGSTPTLFADALTAFGDQCINTTSSPNSFTITGSALSGANVTVSSLSGYTFSITEANPTYDTSLSLVQPGGAYSQQVFVKFNPTLAQSYDGNIVVGGGGATSINVAASGTGTNGTIAVTTVTATGIGTGGASSGGTTISTTCGTITGKGVVWGATANPTISSNIGMTTDGSGNSNYSSTITGTPNTTYHYRAYATNSNGVTDYGANLSFTTLKEEPTAQASSFACGTTTTANIPLTWTDASSGTVPDGYLIKWSATSFAAITAPTDGTAETNSATAQNIAQGTQAFTATGLATGTTYYFKIWSYTNSGANINYNLVSVPQVSCATLAGPWEDFEIGTKLSYASASVTCRAGEWQMSGALIGTSASDQKNGLQSVRMQNSTSFIQTNFNITTGVGTVKINHAKYTGDADMTWRLLASTDEGANWDAYVSSSINSTSSTLSEATFTVNLGGDVRLRIEKLSTNSNSNRLNIDDIYITPFTPCISPSQASNLQISNIAHNSFNTNWTAGNGNGTMIVVRPTSQTNQAPTSGNAYTPNLAWASAGQINTNNRVVFRGSGDTAGPITGLSAETQYTVTAYEYNNADECYNTTSAPTVNFYTLSTEPGSSPGAFGCTVTDYNQITLNFSAASTITNADGYIVLRRTGSAPTGLPSDGNAYSLNASIGDATVVAIINSTSITSANISGLSASTDYYFTIVPFNWNGANAVTYNYRTTGIMSTNCTTPTAPSLASNIVLSGMSYVANIPYASYQAPAPITAETGTINVMGITVQDGGGSNDADILPTIVNAITFSGVTGATMLRAAGLFEGSTLIATGTIGTNTIAFSGMNITVTDNTSKELTLRVSFNATGITDNTQLTFSVTAANVTTANGLSSSQMSAFATVNSNASGDNNKIEVTADRLVFGTQPTSASVSTNLASFTLRFEDSNGNLDFDTNRTVTLTATDGGVNMTSSPSYTLTAAPVHTGIITVSNVQFTTGPQTGITITGTTSGLGFSNSVKSSGFNITMYSLGDYRTNPNFPPGTKILFSSTNATSGIRPWQTYNGSAWVDVTGSSATVSPQHLTTKPENIYITHPDVDVAGGGTYNNIIVEGNDSFLYTASATGLTIASGKKLDIKAGGYVMVELNGKFELSANSSVIVRDDAALDIYSSTSRFIRDSSSNFIIENNGIVYINNYLGNLWVGNENFAGESYFEIYGWDGGNRLFNNISDIDTNSTTNAKFGNLSFVFKNTTALSATWANVFPASTFKLTNMDFEIFSKESDNINLNYGEMTIGRDFIVHGDGLGFIQAQTTNSSTRKLTVERDFIKEDAIEYRQISVNANSTLDILRNLTVSGGNFKTSNSNTNNSIINLYGNLEVANTGSLLGYSATRNIFNFKGATPQTINMINQTTADEITFNVNNGADVRLINQNMALGTNSKLIVENGGTLNFNFSGTDVPLNVTGHEFISQAGSILKITSGGGIASSGSTGNVRTSTRTYATDAPYADYHYIGKVNQDAGNGLPANVRNLIINNSGSIADNSISLSGPVRVNNTLTMLQGNVITNLTNLLELGVDTSNKGILDYSSGFIKGAMKRWFSGTNATGSANDIALGFFPMGTGTTSNLNRFATIEYTTAPTTPGSLTLLMSNASMGNNGLEVLPQIPATGNCAPFNVLGTEDFQWEFRNESTVNGGFYNMTLRKESVATVPVCKNTLLVNDAGNWTAPGTHIEPSGTPQDFIVKRTALEGKVHHMGIGNTNCSATPIVYSGSWSSTPTRFDPIEIQNDLQLPIGVLQACECTVSENITLTIPEGATLELQNGLIVEEDGTLLILDSGSLVQVTNVDNATANNNTGKITMERKAKPMFRYDYTYWSSPMHEDGDGVAQNGEFTLQNLSPITLFDKYFKWNHVAQSWQAIPYGNEAMVTGRGYIVRAPQNFEVEAPTATYGIHTANFIGKPNNGIVRHAVSGGTDKWNLIGNPYPSAIDADLFLDFNTDSLGNDVLDGTLYFWTHNTGIVPTTSGSQVYTYNAGDYAAWNGSGSVATSALPEGSGDGAVNATEPSGYIAAGQSFFVKGTANGEAIFNNSMRVAGENNQFFRPAQPEPINNWDISGKHRVWLNMKGQTKGFSQLLVGYIENATNGLDRRYDGESFGGNQVTFYSLEENKKLAIQGRALPFNNQDQVPLGYKSTLNGTLAISIDHYDGLFEGQNIYLEDKLLNVVHDLKASAYNFTSVTGTFNDRFVLRYLPASELNNPDYGNITNGVIVYQENGKIIIKSQLEDLNQITVFDLLGRIVFDQHNIRQREFGIQNVVMNEQPLILKIKLANGQVVNKKTVY